MCLSMYQAGEKSEIGEPIKVNNLTITEIEEGDHYKYLGIDESVGYDRPLNKQRVIKEYKRRVNKIWKSELNAINKSIAHNSFAIPIIMHQSIPSTNIPPRATPGDFPQLSARVPRFVPSEFPGGPPGVEPIT